MTAKTTKAMSAREKAVAVIGDEDTVIGFGLAGVKYLVKITMGEPLLQLQNLYLKVSMTGYDLTL